MYLFTMCFRFKLSNMEEQKCLKDIEQNISSNRSYSVCLPQICIEIGRGIVVEDLRFYLGFAHH